MLNERSRSVTRHQWPKIQLWADLTSDGTPSVLLVHTCQSDRDGQAGHSRWASVPCGAHGRLGHHCPEELSLP